MRYDSPARNMYKLPYESEKFGYPSVDNSPLAHTDMWYQFFQTHLPGNRKTIDATTLYHFSDWNASNSLRQCVHKAGLKVELPFGIMTQKAQLTDLYQANVLACDHYARTGQIRPIQEIPSPHNTVQFYYPNKHIIEDPNFDYPKDSLYVVLIKGKKGKPYGINLTSENQLLVIWTMLAQIQQWGDFYIDNSILSHAGDQQPIGMYVWPFAPIYYVPPTYYRYVSHLMGTFEKQGFPLEVNRYGERLHGYYGKDPNTKWLPIIEQLKLRSRLSTVQRVKDDYSLSIHTLKLKHIEHEGFPLPLYYKSQLDLHQEEVFLAELWIGDQMHILDLNGPTAILLIQLIQHEEVSHAELFNKLSELVAGQELASSPRIVSNYFDTLNKRLVSNNIPPGIVRYNQSTHSYQLADDWGRKEA